MINMNWKPYHLPQISTPFNIVVDKLNDEGIEHEFVKFDPNELNASQGITFSDVVNNVNLNDNNPIWVAGDDNKVIDGHHRWIKALLMNKPIIAVKIKRNEKDGCRILNKIQDIYEYEQNLNLEEVVVQDTINDKNDIDNNYDFLNSLEEDNIEIQDDENKNNKIIIGYRKDPIKENSVVGNFFTLKPINGFKKYEIEFENLLDTNDLGLTYLESQEPIELLAKLWFPNINFEKISEVYNMPSNNIKTKAIAIKANKLGYDGIKYGDSIIQGLK